MLLMASILYVVHLLYSCSCRAQVVSILEDKHLDHLDHYILDSLGPK